MVVAVVVVGTKVRAKQPYRAICWMGSWMPACSGGGRTSPLVSLRMPAGGATHKTESGANASPATAGSGSRTSLPRLPPASVRQLRGSGGATSASAPSSPMRGAAAAGGGGSRATATASSGAAGRGVVAGGGGGGTGGGGGRVALWSGLRASGTLRMLCLHGCVLCPADVDGLAAVLRGNSVLRVLQVCAWGAECVAGGTVSQQSRVHRGLRDYYGHGRGGSRPCGERGWERFQLRHSPEPPSFYFMTTRYPLDPSFPPCSLRHLLQVWDFIPPPGSATRAAGAGGLIRGLLAAGLASRTLTHLHIVPSRVCWVPELPELPAAAAAADSALKELVLAPV